MIGLQEQIESVDRELKLRSTHYPRWVQQGKLTQAAADLELLRMRAVRATLVGLLEKATA